MSIFDDPTYRRSGSGRYNWDYIFNSSEPKQPTKQSEGFITKAKKKKKKKEEEEAAKEANKSKGTQSKAATEAVKKATKYGAG